MFVRTAVTILFGASVLSFGCTTESSPAGNQGGKADGEGAGDGIDCSDVGAMNLLIGNDDGLVVLPTNPSDCEPVAFSDVADTAEIESLAIHPKTGQVFYPGRGLGGSAFVAVLEADGTDNDQYYDIDDPLNFEGSWRVEALAFNGDGDLFAMIGFDDGDPWKVFVLRYKGGERTEFEELFVVEDKLAPLVLGRGQTDEWGETEIDRIGQARFSDFAFGADGTLYATEPYVSDAVYRINTTTLDVTTFVDFDDYFGFGKLRPRALAIATSGDRAGTMSVAAEQIPNPDAAAHDVFSFVPKPDGSFEEIGWEASFPSVAAKPGDVEYFGNYLYATAPHVGEVYRVNLDKSEEFVTVGEGLRASEKQRYPRPGIAFLSGK